MKFKPVSLGITTGILWGVTLMILTVISFYTDYGKSFLESLPQSIYPGFSISIQGSFVGLAIGFFDGLIFGSVFGWLYNKIARV